MEYIFVVDRIQTHDLLTHINCAHSANTITTLTTIPQMRIHGEL